MLDEYSGRLVFLGARVCVCALLGVCVSGPFFAPSPLCSNDLSSGGLW